MSGKKYAIHPGYVYSKFDGGEHYVGYRDLISLYRIKSSECFEWDESHTMGRKHDDYIHLFPQSDGNYRLPTEKPQMTERELLRKAAKTDPVARGAYADWLDEHDEPLLASVYRLSVESMWELRQVLAEAGPDYVHPTRDGIIAAMIALRESATRSMLTPSRLIAEPSGMNYMSAMLDARDNLFNGGAYDRILFGCPDASRPQGVIHARSVDEGDE